MARTIELVFKDGRSEKYEVIDREPDGDWTIFKLKGGSWISVKESNLKELIFVERIAE
jgi:hypothetical protein